MDKVINKSYKSYDYISRYTSFPYYYNVDDDKYIYGTTAQLGKDVSYVIHTVKRNDTIDNIALRYYNNPTLYWVICDFNDIQDPFIKLNVGEKIKIPSIGSIYFSIS